ncbi:MAG: hypothetical protein F9K40_15900 [Kofleriaceae bacterium]|nr:MAG: hypothetical protein F9K40_15900 [Kofleriaceae bacterium]MBZ0236147.1 hypothetical protein [Kofleriaceae bacterium]
MELRHPIILAVAVVGAGVLTWLNLRYVKEEVGPPAGVAAVAANPVPPLPARTVESERNDGADRGPDLGPPQAGAARAPDDAPDDAPTDVIDPCASEAIRCADRAVPKKSARSFRRAARKAREQGDPYGSICVARDHVESDDPTVAGGAWLEIARSWNAGGCRDESLAALRSGLEILPAGADRDSACALCAELADEVCAPCVAPPEADAGIDEGAVEEAVHEEAQGPTDTPATEPAEPIVVDAAAPVTSPAPTTPVSFSTRCRGAAVKPLDDGVRIEGGWCFYIALPNPPKTDHVIELEVRLHSGRGYGVWFAGAWSGDSVTAPAAQYDAGAGGIKFVAYPDTETSVAPMRRAKIDGGWHRWRIERAGSRVTLSLDGDVILERDVTGRNQFGLRTWNAAIDVRNATVTR